MAIESDDGCCARRFARGRPWSGTIAERRDKFRQFQAAVAAAFGVTPSRLIFASPADPYSTRGCFIPKRDAMILRGPLSVVTIAHEWGL